MGKEKLIPIGALIVLLIGASSTVYVYATQVENIVEDNDDVEILTIWNKQYTLVEVFYLAEPRTFTDLNFSGIALDDLIIKIGIDCPECYTYTIIADDGYQKTVNWENMQNGLLTSDKMSVFSDLPKAFRIKNIIEIEVK
jgi:hypothetical protein